MQRVDLDIPKVGRHREVRACLPCRNGKLKCDQTKPRCQRCLANNRTCVYIKGDRSRSNAEGQPTCIPSPTSITSENGSTQKSYTPSLDTSKSGERTIWPNQAGHLTAGDDAQLRYYASSSWVAALEDLEDSQPSTSTPDSDSGSSKDSYSQSGHPQTNLESPTGELYDFIHLPDVNRLICWYSEFVQFWFPFVDGPDIIAALRNLRRSKSCPAGSSALLAAMCYTASSSLQASNEVESLSIEPSAWKELAEELLTVSQYPRRPNLNTIQAAFLLAAPSLAETEVDPDPVPISVLVRAAYSIGLHRDPVAFQSSPRETDSRRILWWSIQGLDVGYSFAHSLPPLIHSTSYDVKMIAGGHKLETKFLETRSRFSLLFSGIAEEIYSVRKPTEGSFQRLNEDVQNVYDYIMTESQRCSTGALEDYIILCERLNCYKLIYLLHQPYLRSARWPQESRQKALKACQSYIKEFLAAVDNPLFAPYSWLLNHSNVYHALAIILQDLIQYPYSVESIELLTLTDPTVHRLSSQKIFRPCPPCKHLWKLHIKACETNQWAPVAKDVDTRLFDTVMADWDPVFGSFIWDDPSPIFSSI